MGPSVTNLASLIGLQDDGGEIANIDLEPIIASASQTLGTDVDPKALSDAIGKALKQALSTDIGAIFGQSWKSIGSVAAAIKETAKDKSSQAIIPLASHQIQTSLEPQISLLRDGLLNIKLPFDASLTWEVKGAEVLVAGGKLASFKLGSLAANGTLKFAGQTIFKANPKLFEPKQSFKFAELEEQETAGESKVKAESKARKPRKAKVS